MKPSKKGSNTIGLRNLSRGLTHARRASNRESRQDSLESKHVEEPMTAEQWAVIRQHQEAMDREELRRLRDAYNAHEAEIRRMEWRRVSA